MSGTAKRAAAAVAALLVGLAAVTGWALESGGVAVVTTRTAQGELRETHVWYAETGGELWLEAGTPENPWYADVRRDPVLALRLGDAERRYRAEPFEDPASHERIRALMRARYGWRDVWVAWGFDVGRSHAVRLVPLD